MNKLIHPLSITLCMVFCISIIANGQNRTMDRSAEINSYPLISSVQQKDKFVVIKGKVEDVTGMSLAGVSVYIKGTKYATNTGKDGNFSLKVQATDNIKLTVSLIGMQTQTIVVKDSNKFQNIVMKESTTELGELVCTGMQNVEKDKLTGSVSVISAKDLRGQGITSIDRILEGMVSGLNSTTISGAPGSRSKISIRGENTLNGNTEPLWIIDGLPMLEGVPKNNSGNYAGTIMEDGIGNILPEDIESITILKDASAAAIYGARAANGVIVIKTKKGFRSKTQINYNGTYNISEAPRIHLDMMNSVEKLKYERSLIDYFGPKTAFNVGRTSMLYKLMTGYITQEQYDKEMSRLQGINTNWFEEIFRVSQSHQHSINIRGGSEALTYYTTMNFTDSKGILEANSYKSGGIFLRMDYRPIEKLILGIDVSANTRFDKNHASIVDPFKYAAFANTYERPYDKNGNYEADLSFLGSNYTSLTPSGYVYDKFNIIREMRQNTRSQTGLDLSTTFNLKYEPIQGLILTALLRSATSYNYSSTEIDAGTYTSYITESLARIAYPGLLQLPKEYDNGQLKEESGRSSGWSGRFQTDYSFTLNDNHLFSLMGAIDFSSRKFNNFGYTSPIYYSDYRITGFPGFTSPSVNFKELYNAIKGNFNTNDGQDRTLSYIGNIRYSFLDKYILNLSARLDGADVIGNKNQFTPLWSVGGRYNLYKESFMKNIPYLSDLVLRGSYGYTGQIDREAYPYSIIELSNIVYEGNRIVNNYQFPNPTVKWARKRDWGLGIDVGFWKNRMSFSLDYYANKTEDILTQVNVPNSTGRVSAMANGGIVKNSGWEFSMNVRWIDTQNWIFSTRFNISSNKNVILKSLHDYNSIKKILDDGRVVLGGVYNLVGEETGAIYGWKEAGINRETGNPRYYLTPDGKVAYKALIDNIENMRNEEKLYYKNFLKDLTNVPDYVDYPSGEGARPKDPYFMPSLQYLGRTNPKYVGGFSTYLRYRHFEFTTYWSYKMGHLIPTFNDYQNAPRTLSGQNNNDLIAQGYSGDLAVSATNREKKYLNYWQQPGDMTDIRGFISSGTDLWASIVTDKKYEKGDYLRLNTLSLSYRFNGDWVNKFQLNNILFSLNARNIFTITKYKGIDVATGNAFGYPVAREYSVKVTLGF